MNNFYDKFVYCVRIVFGGFCEHFGCFEFVKLGWLEMSGNLFHYFCMYVSNITDWSVCVKQNRPVCICQTDRSVCVKQTGL